MPVSATFFLCLCANSPVEMPWHIEEAYMHSAAGRAAKAHTHYPRGCCLTACSRGRRGSFVACPGLGASRWGSSKRRTRREGQATPQSPRMRRRWNRRCSCDMAKSGAHACVDELHRPRSTSRRSSARRRSPASRASGAAAATATTRRCRARRNPQCYTRNATRAVGERPVGGI